MSALESLKSPSIAEADGSSIFSILPRLRELGYCDLSIPVKFKRQGTEFSGWDRPKGILAKSVRYHAVSSIVWVRHKVSAYFIFTYIHTSGMANSDPVSSDMERLETCQTSVLLVGLVGRWKTTLPSGFGSKTFLNQYSTIKGGIENLVLCSHLIRF